MKKILFGYWFYTIGCIIFVLLNLGLFSLFIALAIIYPETYIDSQLSSWIILVIFFFAATTYCVIMAGFQRIQFAVVSDEEIKIRAPFRTIRSLKWEEIKEVCYEIFNVGVYGTSGWYVFYDGIEREQYTGLTGKKTHITIHASKRNRKIIEMFWHEPIIEKEIKN